MVVPYNHLEVVLYNLQGDLVYLLGVVDHDDHLEVVPCSLQGVPVFHLEEVLVYHQEEVPVYHQEVDLCDHHALCAAQDHRLDCLSHLLGPWIFHVHLCLTGNMPQILALQLYEG